MAQKEEDRREKQKRNLSSPFLFSVRKNDEKIEETKHGEGSARIKKVKEGKERRVIVKKQTSIHFMEKGEECSLLFM